MINNSIFFLKIIFQVEISYRINNAVCQNTPTSKKNPAKFQIVENWRFD